MFPAILPKTHAQFSTFGKSLCIFTSAMAFLFYVLVIIILYVVNYMFSVILSKIYAQFSIFTKVSAFINSAMALLFYVLVTFIL